MHNVLADQSVLPGGSGEKEGSFPNLLLPWMLFSLLNFSLTERTSKCVLNAMALFQPAVGLQR